MTIPRDTRPPRSAIKAIHLHEAEYLKPDGREVMDAHEPRYLLIYLHMNKAHAKLLRDYLNDNLKDSEALTGAVLVPIMGRMVG
jgi:hypothetical protein